jgi:DNA-binding winged helix-turn-helix (wHTH) protein
MPPIPPSPAPILEFGPYRLDTAGRELRRGRERVHLTPKSFDTLVALAERRERVVTKAELMSVIWPDRAVEEANLTQHVFTLRKVLRHGSEGDGYIATVPRRGYRFVGEVREITAQEACATLRAAEPERRWGRALLGVLAVVVALAIAAMASHADEPHVAGLVRTEPRPEPSRLEPPASRPVRARVTLELDTPAGPKLWTSTVEGDLGDVPLLQDEVARAIAREIECARMNPR